LIPGFFDPPGIEGRPPFLVRRNRLINRLPMTSPLAEVLGGSGEEELALGAVRASQTQSIQFQDALGVNPDIRPVAFHRMLEKCLNADVYLL
jgi:hypothetical protein